MDILGYLRISADILVSFRSKLPDGEQNGRCSKRLLGQADFCWELYLCAGVFHTVGRVLVLLALFIVTENNASKGLDTAKSSQSALISGSACSSALSLTGTQNDF